MEFRTLDLNILSAKDLKDVNLFSKMDVFAVVSIAGDPLNPQTATTHTHRDGGKNPTWNYPVKFTVNESLANQNRLSLEVKLISDRTLSGNTVIGTVHIPLKELLDNPAGDSYRQVSYQVVKSSGKPQGTLNLSYKFGERVEAPAIKPATKTAAKQEPVMAYPPPGAAAGSSSVPYGTPAYPPPQHGAYPPPAAAYGGYPPTQPGYGYPPQQAGYGYPPQQAGYGYPPQQAGYGYPPQQAGYGYPGVQKPQKNKFGMGLGAGLLGGALGGMLIGDMVSDASSYDAGYDAGFDDGGFDF
ncbi:protein SRC2-like [Cicer arietinum]|uniref:Protein SRC2-like n=1 Tax=Cicer arietinum TaxID=3827 RepID=A0A3Q7K740_CICAR|nr:protein SRC2-like [Cicer arietinum]